MPHEPALAQTPSQKCALRPSIDKSSVETTQLVHPSPSNSCKAEEHEGRRGTGGVAGKRAAIKDIEGYSHDNRKQRVCSRDEGAGSTQEQGRHDSTAMGILPRIPEEPRRDAGGKDGVSRKGKAPARDGRKEGGGSSEGIGVTEQAESPGNAAVDEVLSEDQVETRGCVPV